MSAVKYFRIAEVEKHNKNDDIWFIVDHRVYDVTNFTDEHPGGGDILITVAGGDASNGFKSIGHSDSAKEELEKRCIGEVHPDDRCKLKAPVQGTQSHFFGIAIVGVLLLLMAFALLRSLL